MQQQQQESNQHAVELWQLRHALFNYLESPNGSPEADQALGVVIELVDGGVDPEKPNLEVRNGQ